MITRISKLVKAPLSSISLFAASFSCGYLRTPLCSTISLLKLEKKKIPDLSPIHIKLTNLQPFQSRYDTLIDKETAGPNMLLSDLDSSKSKKQRIIEAAIIVRKC